MRPRRFPAANAVFSLEGGTEDNDLWVERGVADGVPFLRSVWEFTPEEREQIAAGHNLSVRTLGTGTPPLSIAITPEQPGRAT